MSPSLDAWHGSLGDGFICLPLFLSLSLSALQRRVPPQLPQSPGAAPSSPSWFPLRVLFTLPMMSCSCPFHSCQLPLHVPVIFSVCPLHFACISRSFVASHFPISRRVDWFHSPALPLLSFLSLSCPFQFTTEHMEEQTRERGRRRKGRGQCRRTDKQALKCFRTG